MTTDSEEQRPLIVEPRLPRPSQLALPKPKRPVGRPPKHGAFSGAELMPIAMAKESEIVEVLMGAKVMIGMADRVPISLLAGCLAKIELFNRYFAACGVFDEQNKPRQDALKVYLAALNAAARLCDQLGMTPQSRLRLGISMIQARKDLASMMSDEAQGDGEGEPA